MKYLVTGATGYIGYMLIKHLMYKNQDTNITAIVRDASKAEKMLPKEVPKTLETACCIALVLDITASGPSIAA